MLAVGLGGDTGAVSHQQSHSGGGARHGHAGGVRVGTGVALVGVRAHVTLELGVGLALNAAQPADEHAAGPRAPEDPPRPAALLPLLAVVLLGVHAQVGERGEAWGTQTHAS